MSGEATTINIPEEEQEHQQEEIKTSTKEDDDKEVEESNNKKQKLSSTMMGTSTDSSSNIEQAPDSEWPEAWYMIEENESEQDQKAANKQVPNKVASVADLRKIGIQYWRMDAHTYDYPVKAVPWDPKDAVDPKLSALRDERGYSYADIISIRPDLLPGYDEKVKSFFEEHIHDAEEIRYILDGSGYFDVRDAHDKWVRIHIKKGDLMTLPEGIYHRFTCDESDYIKAMRLFIGQPIWTPFNRPADDHPSRKVYVTTFIEEEKKED